MTDTLFADLRPEDAQRVLPDWVWLLQRSHNVLRVTRMGDAFVADSRGQVFLLDTLQGELMPIAGDVTSFEDMLRRGAYDRGWFNPGMVAVMQAGGHALAPGECYSYRVPPILGGSFGSPNVRVVSIAVHFSFTGQLHQQLRALPPGSRITEFKFVPR